MWKSRASILILVSVSFIVVENYRLNYSRYITRYVVDVTLVNYVSEGDPCSIHYGKVS
jgi:hypothetical protein